MSDAGLRALSALGFVAMIGVAWVFSSDRGRFPWRIVLSGAALQLALGVLLLKTPVGGAFFDVMSTLVGAFLSYTEEGTRFVFGALVDTGYSIFVNVLPIIIFSGCFFSVLYHLGVLQRIVDVLLGALGRVAASQGTMNNVAFGAAIYL